MQHETDPGVEERRATSEPDTSQAAPAMVDGVRSRRRMLAQAARSLWAAPLVAATGHAQQGSTQLSGRQAAEPLPEPLTKNDPTVLRALVERLGYGFDLALYQRAVQIGYDALLEEQLHPEGIPDPVGDAVVANLPLLSMTSKELLDTFGVLSPIPATQLQAATVLRAAGSSRRLFERVVGVWSDHFSIAVANAQVALFKVSDDREVVRAHALDTFPSMLRASAESAAMLDYLDNTSNTVAGAQENYARELMELHSLGVDGGYTEQDVKEVARCFTGWTTYPIISPQYGEFLFFGLAHDNQAKTVLGVEIPPFGGKSDGDTVLDLLANSSSTSRFIAEKLVSRLLTYDPPIAVTRRVAQTYRATGGDLRAMTREALSFPALQAAQPWNQRKFKRPFHFAAGLLRALDANLGDGVALVERLRGMGQAPFEWGPPNGYPDSVGAWGSNLLPRWSFAIDLMDGAIPGTQVPVFPLLTKLGFPTKDDFVDALDLHLTGGRMDPSERDVVQGYLDEQPFLSGAAIRDTVALTASSPSYQLY